MNVVGTVLLTSIPNPMCPGCDNYPANPAIIEHWLQSLRDCLAVLAHDELTQADFHAACAWKHKSVSFQMSWVEPTDENLFFQRWLYHLRWLEDSTDVDMVWLTDGSDVRMLNPPWDHMEPGVLYVGSEEETLSHPWILKNHPSLHSYANLHPQAKLLNAGLVGGDRETVIEFIVDLLDRREFSGGDLTDMAAFNLAAYIDRQGDFTTGYPVHTRFTAWVESDPEAWWAHK